MNDTHNVPNCEKCGKPMYNLGNVSGVVLASWPPQWDIVYICLTHKIKKTVRERGELPKPTPDLSNYKEQK